MEIFPATLASEEIRETYIPIHMQLLPNICYINMNWSSVFDNIRWLVYNEGMHASTSYIHLAILLYPAFLEEVLWFEDVTCSALFILL